MRIRQIVFAAQDLQYGRDDAAALFRLVHPFRDPGVAELGIDNVVFAFGDPFIEVISRNWPDTACACHLARHGDSAYAGNVPTGGLARDRKRLTAPGVPSAEFVDFSAIHLHPKDVGTATVSVDERRPAPSWRGGGPRWQVQPGRLGLQRA